MSQRQEDEPVSNDIDRQEKLVLWGYVIQWAALFMPPAVAVSLVYLLIIRSRVPHRELRSHVSWQLMTCVLIAALIPIALLLFFTGLSGINMDSPVSIVATFALVGGSVLFLPWLLYRLLNGTIRFARQEPMKSLIL